MATPDELAEAAGKLQSAADLIEQVIDSPAIDKAYDRISGEHIVGQIGHLRHRLDLRVEAAT